mmetsp:Transcript_92205/g.152719  ORF Transcript_92205/g.152719 Transcript_92205/m.152719 type:complete len:394 (-) Transcript_92205:116-1297(-)
MARGMLEFAFCRTPYLSPESQTLEVEQERVLPPFAQSVSCIGFDHDQDLLEWNIESARSNRSCGSSVDSRCFKRNLSLAVQVINDVFRELETQCVDEQSHYRKVGLPIPRNKNNIWATYTSKERLRHFMSESREFLRHHADFRTRLIPAEQLRFLVMLQHFAQEDTSDFYRPERLRKHQDAFEGVLTDAVNSQLIRDAHRSEWSIDGRAYSLQELPQPAEGRESQEERRQTIIAFQREFVKALETFLVSYCHRRQLSALGTKRMIQAVTTQMSQCGLANLDRGSQSARYVVSSQGLDQRTVYNVSTMEDSVHGELLKLSILCMKTGFTQYLDKQDEKRMAPRTCHPSSYLYQYATLQFVPLRGIGNTETIACTIIDALDEIEIVPENLEEVGI